jgi:hypothetical protein
MQEIPKCLALIAVIAFLAGCTALRQREGEVSDRERYWYYAGEPVPSFMTGGRISGWRPLAKYELVVWTRFDDAYLLTVDPTCIELATAGGISIRSRTGNTVSSGFDSIGIGRERCLIREIRPVDYRLMKQEARELRNDRS